jgi:hypothetical protein
MSFSLKRIWYYTDRVAVIGQFIVLLQLPYRYKIAFHIIWRLNCSGELFNLFELRDLIYC